MSFTLLVYGLVALLVPGYGDLTDTVRPLKVYAHSQPVENARG